MDLYSTKISDGLYKSLRSLPIPSIAAIETIDNINLIILLLTYYSYNDHLKTYPLNSLIMARDTVGNNIYGPAAAVGNIGLIKYLSGNGELDIDNVNNNKNTPFLIASAYGQIDVLKYLIESNRVNIHHLGIEGRNAILFAAYFGQLETIKFLESNGVSYNTLTDLGRNVFFIACEIGDLNIVKYFENKKDIDLNLFDTTGMTPYLFAAAKGHIDILSHLRNNNRINLKITDKQYNSNAFIWAASGEHIEAMDIVSYPTSTQTLISMIDLYKIQDMQIKKNSSKLKKWMDDSQLFIKV